MLRAVNVGGRKVAMKALQQVFVDLGYEDAATYIQSGNVVFTGPAGPAGGQAAALRAAVARGIEERIAADLGVPTSVLLRSGPELDKVVAANPFLAGGAEAAHLHVTFLAAAPDTAKTKAVDPDGYPPDRFEIIGREVYLHCPDGYGRSKLTNAFWERRLGVAATTRNWRSVTTMRDLALG